MVCEALYSLRPKVFEGNLITGQHVRSEGNTSVPASD